MKLLTFMISILSVGYGYVGWRMISLAKMNTFGNIVSWLVVVCGIILPPITFFLFFNRKETS
ncbi:hypothetical protein IT568_13580, partial [bacterium]|nr:hypothetical protein [bacterium]